MLETALEKVNQGLIPTTIKKEQKLNPKPSSTDELAIGEKIIPNELQTKRDVGEIASQDFRKKL